MSEEVKLDPVDLSEHKFWLDSKHHKAAKKIIQDNVLKRYKYKHHCNWCNDTRIKEINNENCIVPCSKCVDTYQCMQDWLNYVKHSNDPVLIERYLQENTNENKNGSEGNGSTTGAGE